MSNDYRLPFNVYRLPIAVKLMDDDQSKYADLKYFADMAYQKTTSVNGPYIEVEKINLSELETSFNNFILEVRKQIVAINQA